jgi:hypothetical protein
MLAQAEQGKASGREIIDEVVYLASLASERGAINPLLDRLRRVTARVQGSGTALTSADQSELRAVEQGLTTYLIKRDPLRSFTPELLRRRLDEQMGRGQKRLRMPRVLAVILGLSGAGFALMFALMPASLDWYARVTLALAGFIVPLHAGIIWLFWSALEDFSKGLRRAYALICLGIAMTMIGAMQFPFLFAFPRLLEWPVFRYGGFLPLFAVMCGLFYFGLRIFVRLLGIKTWLTSPVVWVVVGALTVMVTALPHRAAVADEAFFDLSVASFALCAFISVPNALMARATMRHVTGRYDRAMKWFSITQTVIVVASVVYAAAVFVVGPTTAVAISMIASPFMVSELLLLVSGYVFKRDVAA